MARTDQPRALALFTDREDERAVIHAFLSRLQDGRLHERPSVLNFYGVGGVGKTKLREKALSEYRLRLEQDIHLSVPPHIAEIDLDSDSVTPNLPIAQLIGRVRTALHRHGIRTPLFDYLYLVWWAEENPHQSINLKRRAETEGMTAGFFDIADLASNLASLFGAVLPVSAVAKGIRTLIPKLGNWFEHTRARQRFGGLLEYWSQRERIERMPIMLAHDLLDAIAHQPQIAICIVIDGFERVQSRESKPDAQWALSALIAEVLRCTDIIPAPDGKPLRGRVGFMVFGREKLRWSELYARESVRTNWRKEINDHAQLQGLSEQDARGFLVESAARLEREHGNELVAELIERHVAPILQAASERLPEREPSFLPYYLDLAVLLIRENAHHFEPAMLGSTPGELERRFLRNLEDRHRKALQALALSLEFDRKTFEFLIERGLASGYTPVDFDWLVGDHWSFVTPTDRVSTASTVTCRTV